MGGEVKYAPKGYFVVYVGEEKKKRFVVLVSLLKNSSFQKLLSKVEGEFGFDHPRGGLTIPCTEEAFIFLGFYTAKQILQQVKMGGEVKYAPKSYFSVYVGEDKKKRFVVPVSLLKNSSFQKLLSKVEEKFGFDHPRGGLTIPCTEEAFIDATSDLNC